MSFVVDDERTIVVSPELVVEEREFPLVPVLIGGAVLATGILWLVLRRK